MASPEKLSVQTIAILKRDCIFVSAISLFEIAIKQKIGKLPEFDISPVDLSSQIEQDGFNLLNLSTHHIDAYRHVPLLSEHRDPFDRLLLATALSENMAIISSDAHFTAYRPLVSIVSAYIVSSRDEP